jgi:truncated hemoglobin YjbI
MPSLFEHAGGAEAIHRLEEAFYAKVLADPLLIPLFAGEAVGASERFGGEMPSI